MSKLHHFIQLHSVIKYAGVFTTVATIQEAVALVKRYHIKAEIIGNWLYCFPPPLLGVQLQCIGFWYSNKHAAIIYSGTEKQGMADGETLDQIRARLGSRQVRG